MRAELNQRRLHAPRGNGQALIVPPLPDAARQLGCCGPPPPHLAAARQELLELARQHTSQYLDVGDGRDLAQRAAQPIVMTGHQPQLFHPGVWFKNFATAELARRNNAQGIHLLVDNDLCGAASLHIPTHRTSGSMTTVAWDEAAPEVPWEDRQILSSRQFDDFGRLAAAAISSISPTPIVADIWPQAIAARRRGKPAGQALAEARHTFESRHGLRNWELPLSRLCESAAFCQWTADTLARLPELSEIYNRRLSEYRRSQRIRSRSHPVPELQRAELWWEAPFWVWQQQTPRRRRLFVRLDGGSIRLTDREQWNLQVPSHALAEALQELPQAGVRLRPRALMTTMFARTHLCDQFLHGIGGAAYDRLTDALIADFYRHPPPPFVTLTATMLLVPLPVAEHRQRLRQIAQQLRDLEFNPQRHLQAAGAAKAADSELVDAKLVDAKLVDAKLADAKLADAKLADLIEEKQRWIARGQSDLARRHREIRRLNALLQPYVARQRAALIEERDQLRRRLPAESRLASREHSFCLFDVKELPQQLLDLAAIPS